MRHYKIEIVALNAAVQCNVTGAKEMANSMHTFHVLRTQQTQFVEVAKVVKQVGNSPIAPFDTDSNTLYGFVLGFVLGRQILLPPRTAQVGQERVN